MQMRTREKLKELCRKKKKKLKLKKTKKTKFIKKNFDKIKKIKIK